MSLKPKNKIFLFLILSLLFFTLLFYFFDLHIVSIQDSFLTIATFVFSIFLGFFISKQTTRIEQISQNLSTYDGCIVSIHQGICDLNIGIDEKSSQIISTYYNESIIGKKWNYIFDRQDELILKIRELVRNISVPSTNITEKTAVIFDNIYDAIDECESVRRKVISLKEEKIPQAQWIIVYLLLIVTSIVIISTLNSYTSLFLSIVKSCFISAIIFSVFLLKKLDDLTFFDMTVAEESAKDVLLSVKYNKP